MPDMEMIRLIKGRRSIRRFQPRPVEPERAAELLECAFAAPSSKNHRPCHFILIDDKALLELIGNATPAAKMAAGAALGIEVCVNVRDYEERSGLSDGTWMEDSAAAMENILLAARALDLEGVWLQIVNRADREGTIPGLLGIPEGITLFSIALLGYPAEEKIPIAAQTRLGCTKTAGKNCEKDRRCFKTGGRRRLKRRRLNFRFSTATQTAGRVRQCGKISADKNKQTNSY